MPAKSYPALKIGYLWQYPTVDISRISAPALHVQAVIQGLQRLGHQVRLLTFHQGQIHFTDDLTNWHPVELASTRSFWLRPLEKVVRGIQSRLHLPFFSFFDSYRFSEACAAALADYDLFYERHWLNSYGGLLAAKRLKIPLVYEVNGDIFEEYHQHGIKLSRPQWAVLKYINRTMFHKADHVVSVSEVLAQSTINRWNLNPAKVSTVNNGVDIEKFVNLKDSVSVARRNNLEGRPLIMFVGNFRLWHGVDILIDAFSAVAATNTQAKLILVGDSPLRADLENQVKRLGLADRVIFTGQVDHQAVAKWLHLATVTVLSHRPTPAAMAGSPMKLFEYMAAGKAIVAPALPNIEKILTHRKNALLFPPADPAGLAAALLELLADDHLRDRLAQTGRAEAVQKYSWDRAVRELLHIFRSLTGTPAPQTELMFNEA